MIEKKTMWAVTDGHKIEAKTVLTEDGIVLAHKSAENKQFSGSKYDYLQFFDTEDEARKFIEDEEQEIRDMMPKVKKFILTMDYRWRLRKKLCIEKKDYLAGYADSSDSSRDWYDNECEYAKKLENFIKSRTLNIDGYMIPVDNVKRLKWFGIECAEDYEAGQWKAEITTANNEQYETNSENDVRLLWAVFGKASGTWFIDNDIDYDKQSDNDE